MLNVVPCGGVGQSDTLPVQDAAGFELGTWNLEFATRSLAFVNSKRVTECDFPSA